MAYFNSLPNVDYLSPFNTRQSNDTYIRAKNLFKRVKISDTSFGSPFLFNKYIIQEGERPDTMSSRIYGTSSLDWLIVLAAGIVNQRHEWPLSSQELYEYCYRKYGNDLNAFKHYETLEVKDSNGRVVLPAGKVVDKDFTIPNPDSPLSTLNPVQAVTNYEYEYLVNDAKKEIDLIRPEYKLRIVTELRELFKYQPDSSQYINSYLKRTDNVRKKSP